MTHYLQLLEKVHSSAIKAGRKIEEITLVAVTKNHPVEEMQLIYNEGCRDFGENRMQEALSKIDALSADIAWHFIGTLQKNKVAKAINQFHLIHSVDHFELAQKISTTSQKLGTTTRILLQVNTSGEASKQGLSEEEWRAVWETLMEQPGLQIEGLMTMAPLTEDSRLIHSTFARLRTFRDALQKEYSIALPSLSMGMSHDFEIAIEEGATILRVGSALFVK
jgi:pyridoxal phosphate enzyme (YggS family)